ncbi:MAG: PKD domain-containing protein [Candidatus Paceibacterota bacterium]
MKKILLGLFVLSFLVVGYNAYAESAVDCPADQNYSSLTGELCGCSHNEVYSSTTGQTCPVIVPSIKVTSPNSGFEAIESGQKVEIRWESNVSINALVDVYVSDRIHTGEVVRTNNNGAHGLIYTLDNSLTPGSNYRAYVSLVSENPVSDSSDNPFIIKPANSGCLNGEVFSSTTGAICPTTPYKITTTTDLTPRISYWQGKVNQHVSVSEGMWQTDSDGVSGAEINKLTYCKKFYPNTTSVVEYKKEYINAWHDRGNVNDYLGLNMSYQCVGIDAGCSNGQVYSSTTGQRCLVNTNPIISGISGPQTLAITQSGTWKVTASSSSGGNLTYSVVWGDEAVQTNYSTATRQIPQQSATFTHSYSQIGTYTPTFTVTNSNGGSAKTSITVKVNNLTNTCPVVLTDCIVGYSAVLSGKDSNGCNSWSCKKDSESDNGCHLGNIYSVTTGKMCPIKDDGCLLGYNYSPITGKACVEYFIYPCTSSSESNCFNPTTSITRTLKVGTTGEDVKTLQSFLGINADGVFGRGTQASVINWQTSKGLTADGAFGSMSRAKAGFTQ